MGAADVVPGVSGGTMAYILGIYERLLAAINSFDLGALKLLLQGKFKAALSRPDFAFIIPLMIGIFSALIFFTRIIPLPKLILSHPTLIYGLFFGLILGSIVVLTKQIGKIDSKGWILIILGVVVGFCIVTMTPKETPESSSFIFFCGMLAITAMILPGISGSFILLILGKYAYIMDGIGHFDLAIILPFAAGAATGLIVFSRFLYYLLQHFKHQTLLVINGILIGSLWVIWPFQERKYLMVREKQRLIESQPQWPSHFDSLVFYSFLLILVGFLLVLMIEYIGSRNKI